MYARFGLMVLVSLFVVCFPVATIANDGTFGLGVSSGNNFASMSMFGLDADCVQAKAATKETVVVAPSLVAAKPVEAVSDSRVAIVRRARSSWVDSSVGAWSVEKLRSHLRGELASPQHRGKVPTSELEGRTLRELADIHDNLHEGFEWNGGSSVVHSRSVTVQSFQTTAKMASSCPGGVCPSPMSRPVRRLFRR
jgi:hypothetical protein